MENTIPLDSKISITLITIITLITLVTVITG